MCPCNVTKQKIRMNKIMHFSPKFINQSIINAFNIKSYYECDRLSNNVCTLKSKNIDINAPNFDAGFVEIIKMQWIVNSKF